MVEMLKRRKDVLMEDHDMHKVELTKPKEKLDKELPPLTRKTVMHMGDIDAGSKGNGDKHVDTVEQAVKQGRAKVVGSAAQTESHIAELEAHEEGQMHLDTRARTTCAGDKPPTELAGETFSLADATRDRRLALADGRQQQHSERAVIRGRICRWRCHGSLLSCLTDERMNAVAPSTCSSPDVAKELPLADSGACPQKAVG